jgi:hypothetical protein
MCRLVTLRLILTAEPPLETVKCHRIKIKGVCLTGNSSGSKNFSRNFKIFSVL